MKDSALCNQQFFRISSMWEEDKNPVSPAHSPGEGNRREELGGWGALYVFCLNWGRFWVPCVSSYYLVLLSVLTHMVSVSKLYRIKQSSWKCWQVLAPLLKSYLPTVKGLVHHGWLWQQACSSMVGKHREMITDAQLASFLPWSMCRPHSGWLYHPQLSLSGNTWVIIKPVKLTVRTNCCIGTT